MKSHYIFLGFISIFFFLAAMPVKHGKKSSAATDFNFLGNLQGYALPNDADSPTDLTALAKFAWEEMIALNWKSTYNATAKPTRRATPDKNWEYSQAFPDGNNSTVVWETFAHRQELRPANTGSKADFDFIQKSFDAPPSYSFGTQGNVVEITGKDANTKLNLFNCLDEDNEIGSCLMFSNVSNKSDDDTESLKSQVLYQAKINRVGYEYRANNFNGYASIVNAASTATKKVDANGNPLLSNVKGNIGTCNADVATNNGYICFPCAGVSYTGKAKTTTDEGVIEIKTAWIRYDSTIHSLDEYFHRNVIYFEENKHKKNAFIAKNDIFLLVAMHINRKTVSVPTFIIATFEHNDLESQGYKYVTVPGGQGDYAALYKISPAQRRTKDLSYFKHKHGYDAVSAQAHKDLRAVNSNHYLLNYHLVGVQGSYSNGYPDDSDEPSFFLSNYAVESDNGLSNFYGNFGLPQQGDQVKTTGFFNLIMDEGAQGNKGIIAGGCKGCHGIAQTGGFDMSFLMDKNRPAPEPDVSFLSVQELDSVLFYAYALVNPPPANPPVPSTTTATVVSPAVVLSVLNNDTRKYMLRFDPSQIYLGTIPYNTNINTFGVDLDGYPRANFKFVNYVPLTKTTGTVQLQYVADPNNKTEAMNPAPDVFYYGNPGFNYMGLTENGAVSTFNVTLKKGGIIELSNGSSPIYYDFDHNLFTKIAGKGATQFIVNGVNQAAFNAINGQR